VHSVWKLIALLAQDLLALVIFSRLRASSAA
jgi:hypothetical protein